jgi:hypothetical protein
MNTYRYMECIGIAMDALRTGDAATADAAANLAREVRIGSRWIDEQRDALVEMVDAAGPDGLDRRVLCADEEEILSTLLDDGIIVKSGLRLHVPRFTADALLATLEASGLDGMTQSTAEREHGARAVRDAIASGAAVRVRRGGGFRLYAADKADDHDPFAGLD